MFLAAAFLLAAAPRAHFSQQPKPIIFAVLNDGRLLEPIAFLEGGKLLKTVGGGDEGDLIKQFNQTYYKAKTQYRLIHGGANAGSVSVRKLPDERDCAQNTAEATVKSTKTRLRGRIMALATNAPVKEATRSFRRALTTAERIQVEKLAREEFKVLSVNAKVLKNHNLTAVDIDGDGRPEFVGTYYVADTPKSRALLFVVVSRDGKGIFNLEFSNVGLIQEHQIMSRDITDVDRGVLNELLLDVFDIDGDGVAEIFTYIQNFEGSNFRVHTRKKGEWDIMYDNYNYHCGY